MIESSGELDASDVADESGGDAVRIPVDRPIRTASEDALQRARLATGFAEQITRLDAGDGLVVGVLGPWGSGKTSFLNLACEELDRRGLTVVNFNPWMFSGASQLVETFFIEISGELK